MRDESLLPRQDITSHEAEAHVKNHVKKRCKSSYRVTLCFILASPITVQCPAEAEHDVPRRRGCVALTPLAPVLVTLVQDRIGKRPDSRDTPFVPQADAAIATLHGRMQLYNSLRDGHYSQISWTHYAPKLGMSKRPAPARPP